MIELVDTHCHIHFADYPVDPEAAIKSAKEAGVTRLLLVGTTLEDSKLAIKMAQKYDNCWATIGLHPHEAKKYVRNDAAKTEFADLAKKPKVVAVGECGLDYYYNHSSREDQIEIFKFQLEVASNNDLPLIFHVRNASKAFVEVLTFWDYKPIRGVVHSFSGTTDELDSIQESLANIHDEIFFGLNGIMTFTKEEEQLKAAKKVPLQKLLLETDSPFLTPSPFRGKVCEPKHIRVTAEFLSQLRGESLDKLAAATTQNAIKLFGLR